MLRLVSVYWINSTALWVSARLLHRAWVRSLCGNQLTLLSHDNGLFRDLQWLPPSVEQKRAVVRPGLSADVSPLNPLQMVCLPNWNTCVLDGFKIHSAWKSFQMYLDEELLAPLIQVSVRERCMYGGWLCLWLGASAIIFETSLACHLF